MFTLDLKEYRRYFESARETCERGCNPEELCRKGLELVKAMEDIEIKATNAIHEFERLGILLNENEVLKDRNGGCCGRKDKCDGPNQ
jgi:hypothetical protein